MSGDIGAPRPIDLPSTDAQARAGAVDSPGALSRSLRREADLHDRVAERFLALGETVRAAQERLVADEYRAAAERVSLGLT